MNNYETLRDYAVQEYNDNPIIIDFKREYLRKYTKEIGKRTNQDVDKIMEQYKRKDK